MKWPFRAINKTFFGTVKFKFNRRNECLGTSKFDDYSLPYVFLVPLVSATILSPLSIRLKN